MEYWENKKNKIALSQKMSKTFYKIKKKILWKWEGMRIIYKI